MVNYNNDDLDQVFSVLSDPTRRAVVQDLSRGEKTVKRLAEPFNMSLPAFSKHMKVLESAGLVSYRKVGRYKYYYLHPKAMYGATKWINDLKSLWEDQLSSLEAYLLDTEEGKGGNKHDHNE